MIEPAELSEGDRKRFVVERLSRCTSFVGDQRGVVGNATELAKRLRDQKRPAARGLPTMRGDTDDPVLLVKAKGTRDDLPPAQPARGTRELPSSPPPRIIERTRAILRNVICATHRAPTVQMPPLEAMAARDAGDAAAGSGRGGAGDDVHAVAGDPDAGADAGHATAGPNRRARSPSHFATEPYMSPPPRRRRRG